MKPNEDQRPHGERTGEPLVSVIVVVFRAMPELPALLGSIFEHKDDDVELIVIDGGSQDGTVEYLQAHRGEIDDWLSEPDRGIYDAMNKAVARARGTYLLHLNAGDKLLNVPKAELIRARQTGIDIAAFRVLVDDCKEFRPSAGFALRFTNTLHHQGTFFRRERFLPYSLQFPIFADFDVNQKLALSGAKIEVFRAVVASHANDGVSNRDSDAIEAEFFAVVRGNHGRWALPFAWVLRKWQGLKIMLSS